MAEKFIHYKDWENHYRKTEKEIFKPLLIEQLFAMLISNIDVLLLSQYSDAAVAAAGISNQILNIILMAMGIINLGATILSLQLLQQENREKYKRIIRNAFYLNFFVSGILFCILYVSGRDVLRFMQTPPDILNGAYQYLLIVGFSLIFQSVINTLSIVYRGTGHVKIIMYTSVVVNMLNILLKSIVLFTDIPLFGEGIMGISMASLVARGIGMVVCFILFWKILPDFRDIFSRFEICRKRMRIILSLGFPSALENISYTTAQVIITAIIAGLGTQMMTAKIYTQNLTAVVFTFAAAFAQVAQITIGRLISEKRLDFIERYLMDTLRRSVKYAVVLSAVIGVLSFFIVRILTKNTDIITTVLILIWINLLLEIARAMNEMLVISLNTTGEVKFPTALSIATNYLFTVLGTFLFGIVFGFGLYGLWIAMILDEYIKTYFLMKRWKAGYWKKINLIK